MPEKAPYKLVVKLDGVKPEHIAAALEELRARAAEYDQTGEASATMTIEGYQEAPLTAVMQAFETWLFYKGKVDCEMTIKRPGLRPETQALLMREKKQTPMDKNGWEAEPGKTTTIRLDRSHYDVLEAAGRQLRAMGEDDSDEPVSSDAPPA